MIKIFSIAPLAPLLISCDRLPSAATVLTGKVTDKDGNPLIGAGLVMAGFKSSDPTSTPVFEVIAESASDGTYSFSQVVPYNTERIEIYSKNTSTVTINDYTIYYFLDNAFQLAGAPYIIPKSNWGKTSVLNYQFIKI